MKKQGFFLALLLALTGAGAYFLWPLSFAFLTADCSYISAIWTEPALDTNGETSFSSAGDTYAADSPEFTQLQELLAACSYHRSLATLLGKSSLDSLSAGYGLQLYFYTGSGEEKSLILGGNREILLDGRVYAAGYGPEKTARRIKEEIRELLGF